MKPAPIPGGLLVAIEGIDGAGKTTLASALHAWLVGQGASVDVSKEPTAGPWGMKLRESAAAGRLTPEQELDYLIRDRIDHVNSRILPALMSSSIVILDRYYPSMVAYQGAAGLPTDVLLEANAFAPRPDVLLILDLPPTEGLSRIRSRGDAPNHFEDEENLVACRRIFLDLPMDKVILDATRPPGDVLAAAQKHILLAIADKLRRLQGSTPEVALAVEQYLPALSA